MCDYCGCRRTGPTAELAAEHERLLELGDVLHTTLHDGGDAAGVFAQLVGLLEYDLFPHIIHALDPEQWDEIDLAHRAVEAVWEEDAASER